MGTYYQDLDRPWFDYDLQDLPGIPNEKFRGPAFDKARPYAACIGAAQTFGRFCAKPYPSLLSSALDLQFLNLGVGGAGPRLFAAPEYLDYLNSAEFVVVQVLAGRSEGNSLFDNSGTNNLFGVRLTDNKPMRFETFFSELVQSARPDLVDRIVRETQSNYVRSYARLLSLIRRPKILLWLSTRSPDQPEDPAWRSLGTFPQLLNRSMVDRIRQYTDDYVECVSSAGIPQELWPADKEIDGTRILHGKLLNFYYPSPAIHAEAATALEPACRRFLDRTGKRQKRKAPAALSNQPVRFVIVSAERTGSDLLRGMLDSHPDCFVGHEIFNGNFIKLGCIPWYLDAAGKSYQDPANFDRELVELRLKDPGSLIERLFQRSGDENYRAAGFKLMYFHGEQNQAARDYLVGSPDIRIIHLKRKNLLRRLVSLKRAQATNEWNTRADAEAPELPPVKLSVEDCFSDFCRIQAEEDLYDGLFKHHPRLSLDYEDLMADPQKAGAQAVEFLGLRPFPNLDIRYRKLATDSLETAVPNYAELRAAFNRWVSFFED